MSYRPHSAALDFMVGLITTVAFCAIVYLVSLHEVPTANASIVNMLLGVLAAKFGDVVGFCFGSSRETANQAARAADEAAPEKKS